MLHVDDVTVRKIKTTRVEVAIESEEPIDAKGWHWLHEQAMKQLDRALPEARKTYDDAFHVRFEDGAVVFYFETEKET